MPKIMSCVAVENIAKGNVMTVVEIARIYTDLVKAVPIQIN